MNGAARRYHLRTSYGRYDMSGDHRDRGVQPDPFKTYPDLKKLLLSRDISWPELSLSAVQERSRLPDPAAVPDPDRLARILRLTHSITGQARYGSEVFYFRSVPSAGALYPFELYVATLGVAGVEDGLYHHDVRDRSLARLRTGHGWCEVAKPLQKDPSAPPVLAFFLTAIFFRSSWKYRDRAYRYHLLDTGHLLESLSLALKSERLPFRICYDFYDEEVNKLLSIDTYREGCLAVVLVSGGIPRPWPVTEPPYEPVESLAARGKVSPREVDYPAIREIHTASSKIKEGSPDIDMAAAPGTAVEEWLHVLGPEKPPEMMGYPDAVMTRRSMRNFVRRELSANQLGYLLGALQADAAEEAESQSSGIDAVSLGLLVGRVGGVAPGFYLVDRKAGRLGRVTEGDSLVEKMAHVCLDQAWLADCALHFLFLSNLELLEECWGPRGYRYAMLTSGRLGQRLYLAATSIRLGCCGIGAFYDREAATLLTVNEQTSLLYLVAVGPVRQLSGE